VADILASADLVARYSRVLDYALDCLTAEQEAETVPADDEVAPQVGTPAWVEKEGDWYAYVGPPMDGHEVLYAPCSGWNRWSDAGGTSLRDNAAADTLAANVRAASAAWNAAHPELPPVVVPERFRETVPQVEPQVEPPEDAGDGDGWGPWIGWVGGECPVPAGTEVEALDHIGWRYRVPASALLWAHPEFGNRAGDIVRYRVRLPKPAEPAPESDTAFLARHGVGEWVASDLDSGEHSRDWRSAWFAITPNGFVFPQEGDSESVTSTPGDTTTPEGRAECDARLVAHLRAEGLT